MGANGQEVDGIGNAKPGDIVYYASGPHVGIYLGDGKVVQCSGNETNTYDNPGPGPEVSSADYMPITSIRRYLIVRDHFGTSADHRTDDTPYTKEQLETIWAIVAQEDNGVVSIDPPELREKNERNYNRTEFGNVLVGIIESI